MTKLRKRLRLTTPPRFPWPGPFEPWAKQYVRRNFWRVKYVFLTREDALQQCALIFVECLKLYEQTAENDAHMMALFKRSVANHWNKHSKRDGNKRKVGLEMTDKRMEAYERTNVELPTINITMIWTAASSELKEVLTLISNGPADVLDILLTDTFVGHNQAQRLRRLNRVWHHFVGIKGRSNLVRELRLLLGIKTPREQLFTRHREEL
jgi:hypothetical protein